LAANLADDADTIAAITKDNDTVAAIVGAAVGALHGASALPQEWRENLLGRLSHDDDGRVHVLLDACCNRWVS
jgi:ADP-ribosyl-[dinitrogen reductase] hydrolase